MSEIISAFETLNSVNVSDKTEKKNGLTYLSWAWAWGEIKKYYPEANFTIYERNTEYGPVNYFTDGRTCWVKTGLTINGLEHIEELPVMDFKNNSIPLERVTSTDVNKAIQRSLTKAAARHGLGLYIYAGEDLPEGEREQDSAPTFTPPVVTKKTTAATVVTLPQVKQEEPERPIPTPVQAYLLAEMTDLRKERGMTPKQNNALFKAQKDALVAAKLAPDKSLEEYTMDEAMALISAMRACFSLTGTELKTE